MHAHLVLKYLFCMHCNAYLWCKFGFFSLLATLDEIVSIVGICIVHLSWLTLGEHAHRGPKLDGGPPTQFTWRFCAQNKRCQNWHELHVDKYKETLCVWSFNVVALLRSQYYNLRLRLSKAAIRCLLLTAPGRLLALLDIWGHIWKRTV